MPAASAEKKLLTVTETAELLGLNVKAVRGYLAHPDEELRLPAFRHGSRWCIPTHRLDGWADALIDHQRKETTTP